MAAIEYEKFTPLHTQRFGVLRAHTGPFKYTSFRRDHNWNTLRTQSRYSKYGKYGYRNRARITGALDLEEGFISNSKSQA